MIRVSQVAERINKMAVTYLVDADLMGPFSKISIPKTSALVQYSPFTQAIFARGGGLTRIDFAITENNKTLITLNRKPLPWDDANLEKAKAAVQLFFMQGSPALLVDALAQDKTIPVTKPFVPSHPIQSFLVKAFESRVNPALASHGGAMHLVAMPIEPTGGIYVDAVFVGSCNGCASAAAQTLLGASNELRVALDGAKKASGSAALDKFTFREIRQRDIPELVVSRN